MNDVLARLSVVLGMDTAAFSTGSARAKKEVTGLERHVSRASGAIKGAVVGMLGAFAIEPIIQAAKASLDYAASLGEVASQLGVTTTELQELRFVATQTGIEQQEMDKALAKLSRTIGEAAGGSKTAAGLFEKMGISIRDSGGNVRSTGSILGEVAEAYNKLGSEAERNALSAEVFGAKLGQKLNPALAMGAKGIQAMRDQAAEMGLVIDEDLIAKADAASDNITALTDMIKMKFTVAIVENAQEINNLAEELLALVSSLGSVREEWRKLQLLMQQVDIWTEPLGTSSWASRMERSTALGREKAIYGGKNSEAYQRGLAAAQRSAELQRIGPAFTTGGGGPLRQIPKRAPVQRIGTPWGPSVQPGLSRAVGASAFGGTNWSQFMPGTGSSDWMRAATASASVVTNAGKVSDLVTRINVAVGGEMVRGFMAAAVGADELAGRAQTVLDRLYPNEAREREYAADLAALKARYGESAENAGRLADAQQRLKNEWIASMPAVDSISAGLSKYIRNAAAAADESEVLNVRVTKSFQDLASESLSALNQLANGVRNGGFLDILTSVLNIGLQLGQSGALGKSVQTFLNQPIGANANGTSWWRGGLSVVGERGPELVNLPRGASVTPNKNLRGLGGGIAEIRPSPYFDVVVDGRIVRASPAIMDGSARVTSSRAARRQQRRL